MIALIQRVSQAKVDVNGETIGQIGKGLLILLGVEKEDNQEKADKLAEKVLNYSTSTRGITYCFTIYISGGYTKRFASKFFKRCAPSIG